MFNHGYVEFNPVYIQTPEIDTIHLKANVKIVINNPDGKSAHSQYKVHSIQVNPFYFPNDSLDYEDQIYDSITIKTLPYYKFVKSKTIASKVRFRPGMVTNKSLIDETYNQLNKLGIYRFVNIESKIDSVYKDEINYTILLNPLKKWVFDFGADFNYTSIKTVGKTLFGISGFVNLKNRNLFKGAESFSTKIEVGTELDFFSANKFNSLSIHYGNELSLPEFYDITGTFRLIKFISKPFTSIISKPDSRTNFKIGVDFEQLSDFYNYISLNSNIEYEWQIKRRKRISLRTFGFSFYVPHTTTKFDTAYLDKNQYLKNSFTGKRLFTSFFLDNVTYYYQSRILNNKQHAYIGSFNISGLEVYSVNKLYNAINGSDEAFSLGPFEFSNFVKTESDYRFYLTFSDKSKLVCRMDAGIAVPYGNSTSVPFIKQFYSGGPQSIRGWNIRELGPGSIHDESTDLRAYYAAGDIKLEANVEYRFDIFWRFKGALFLEAGNIWLLPRVESTDKRGEFSNQFYNDIAIGTGFGVRFDLSYFLFRVDVGFKLRSNYEQDDTKSHWLYSEKKPVSVKRLFENSTIHIALDYPF
jgi:outer membrane protein assembly factor BamA